MHLPRRSAIKVLTIGAITAASGTFAMAQTPLRVRRSLTGMPLDDPDLSTYRDFVRIMQGFDQSKPLSWLGFANQHGSLEGGYKFCPHGDWYFLPWHRAYVVMYETAAQQLTKNKDFAMPYWNWTEMRQLPQAFADPMYKGKPNPLYVKNRNVLTGKYALTDAIVGQTQVIDKIYAETVYEAFGTTRNPRQMDLNPSWVPAGGGAQGILERTPHNTVHNNIGAFMPTAASPRDPVFMMHHGNIDRIWANWNALGRKNSTDKLWLNMPFKDNYLKPDGTPYSSIVRDLLSIADLGYTYDQMPTSDGKSADPERESRLLAVLHSGTGVGVEGVRRFSGAKNASATLTSPFSVKWSLQDDTLKSVTSAAPEARSREVFALISNITMGEGVRSVRVFVNSKNLSTDVRDTDPHYVTTLSFLDHEWSTAHGEGNHKELPSALVNLTDTLKRLSGYKRLDGDHITLQLIPVPDSGVIPDHVGKVEAASIEIVAL